MKIVRSEKELNDIKNLLINNPDSFIDFVLTEYKDITRDKILKNISTINIKSATKEKIGDVTGLLIDFYIEKNPREDYNISEWFIYDKKNNVFTLHENYNFE